MGSTLLNFNMRLQSLELIFASLLLFGQECLASGNSELTGSNSGTTAEEIDSKLGHLVNVYADVRKQCAVQDFVDSTDQTITFDKVNVDDWNNSGYINPETGIFTARTAGIYEVTMRVEEAYTTGKSDIYIYLETSSGRYQARGESLFVHQGSDSDDYDRGSQSESRFMFLDENDTIYLDYKCYNEHSWYTCELFYIEWCVNFYSTN